MLDAQTRRLTVAVAGLRDWSQGDAGIPSRLVVGRVGRRRAQACLGSGAAMTERGRYGRRTSGPVVRRPSRSRCASAAAAADTGAALPPGSRRPAGLRRSAARSRSARRARRCSERAPARQRHRLRPARARSARAGRWPGRSSPSGRRARAPRGSPPRPRGRARRRSRPRRGRRWRPSPRPRTGSPAATRGSSQPFARAMRALSSLETVPTTLAPSALAHWHSRSPTPPAAAWTSTVSPARTRCVRWSR